MEIAFALVSFPMSNGRWTLVTGASSGIGRSLTLSLLKQGKQVIAVSRSEQRLAETVEGFSAGQVKVIPWDLSELDSLSQLAKTVKEKVGPISGLVHCAGIQKTLPLSMTKKETLFEIFSINSFAAMMLVSRFSKKGFFEENSSFVLVSSVAAHEGEVGNSLYAASKGAIEGFLPAAASEVASKGIRLNVVVPGIVNTPMVENFFSNLSEGRRKALEETYPLGLGKPAQVVSLIEFLLSEKADWITGECFRVDGGHMVRKV